MQVLRTAAGMREGVEACRGAGALWVWSRASMPRLGLDRDGAAGGGGGLACVVRGGERRV